MFSPKYLLAALAIAAHTTAAAAAGVEEVSVAEQLAQLRKENADMRASLETYRQAVEQVSKQS